MVRVQLAGIPVQMNNRFSELPILCKDYLTDEEPLITLSVTQNELEEERKKQAEIFTDGYLETVCLYRKLAQEILKYQVFLLHASVLEVDGEGYCFLAHSGTGKTTQTRLWLEHFGSRARVINGDKPLVRLSSDENGMKFWAFGTPWCGKEGMGCNGAVPIKAMFLLERAQLPVCELCTEEFSVDRLFRQLLMPQQPEQMQLLLALMDKLVKTVPCYRLRCNMKEESVVAAYHAAQVR